MSNFRPYTTADRLNQIINDSGISQADILRACEPYSKKYGTSISRGEMSQYVSGKVQPKQDKLTLLGLALNVSEEWLMGCDVPPERGSSDDEMHSVLSKLNPDQKQQVIAFAKFLLEENK